MSSTLQKVYGLYIRSLRHREGQELDPTREQTCEFIRVRLYPCLLTESYRHYVRSSIAKQSLLLNMPELEDRWWAVFIGQCLQSTHVQWTLEGYM